MANPTTAARPGELHGCWQSWQETQVDNVVKTEFENGAVRTRRRFTGKQRIINASVTYPKNLYDKFMDWFNINQQQGAVPTFVKDPLGNEITVQWLAPPNINWLSGAIAFSAQVRMLDRG